LYFHNGKIHIFTIFDEEPDKDSLGFQYQTTDPETGDALIPWQITFSVDERGNISFKGISNPYGIYSIE